MEVLPIGLVGVLDPRVFRLDKSRRVAYGCACFPAVPALIDISVATLLVCVPYGCACYDCKNNFLEK